MRIHRAMERLLAILNLSTVGKAQRSEVLELFTCASGIGISLYVLEWKSAVSLGGAARVRGSARRPPYPLRRKGKNSRLQKAG